MFTPAHEVSIIIPIFRIGNWGFEKVSNLPKSGLVYGKAGLETQLCEPFFSALCSYHSWKAPWKASDSTPHVLLGSPTISQTSGWQAHAWIAPRDGSTPPLEKGSFSFNPLYHLRGLFMMTKHSMTTVLTSATWVLSSPDWHTQFPPHLTKITGGLHPQKSSHLNHCQKKRI